jgi:hypothetical protein
MCKSALLFSKKDYVLGDALRYICRSQRVNLMYALTFPEVLHYCITVRPEILFFDAEGCIFKYDKYREFVDSRVFDIPKIIILSHTPSQYEFEDVNIFSLDKKNYTEKVSEILRKTERKKGKTLTEEKELEYKNKVADLLLELGITTKYLGYEYIKELVVDIIKDKRMLQSFNKKLYPKLAIKYSTQINNIERNIRNVLNIAKRNCENNEYFSRACGKFNEKGIQSNKQFITWLVEEVS